MSYRMTKICSTISELIGNPTYPIRLYAGGNLYYYEDKDGYWVRSEYNDNGDLITFKDSEGIYEDYREMKAEPVEEEIKLTYPILVYNDDKQLIFRENSDGTWLKSEYNERNNRVYFEDHTGFRQHFNEYGQETHRIKANGEWFKKEYEDTDTGKQIYFENSRDEWWKKEFDERGNCTYHLDSDGYWCRQTFDANNCVDSYECSNGKLKDVMEEIKESVEEITMSEAISRILGYKVRITK